MLENFKRITRFSGGTAGDLIVAYGVQRGTRKLTETRGNIRILKSLKGDRINFIVGIQKPSTYPTRGDK